MVSSGIVTVHNDRRALRVLDAFEKLTKSNFAKVLLREEFIAGAPCINCARRFAAEASSSASLLPVAVASSSNEFESDLEEDERCFGVDDVYELSAQLDDAAAFDISRIPDEDSVAELNMAPVEPVVEDLGENFSPSARDQHILMPAPVQHSLGYETVRHGLLNTTKQPIRLVQQCRASVSRSWWTDDEELILRKAIELYGAPNGARSFK